MAENLLAAIWRESRVWPVCLALLLLLNMAVYAWISYSISPAVEELERHYIKAQGDARQAERHGSPVSPRERYERAGRDLLTFRQAIPGRSEFTGLIEEVFTIADDSGLQIDRIAYAPTYEKETALLRYGLSFSVAGGYGQIKRFIAMLEASPRIIAIEEIALSGVDKEEGAAVSLRLRLATYFQADGP